MAIQEYSRPLPFGAISTFRVVQFFASLREDIATWVAARRTERALRMLSDHELNDIGLSRGDIDRVANQLARR
ncbi:MAG: DUF1127 domain-containing protein [Paracoccaceae bacterium]